MACAHCFSTHPPTLPPRLFEDINVCINGFSQFLYVPHEERLFCFLLEERFALVLGSGLWRLEMRSWMDVMETVGSQRKFQNFRKLWVIAIRDNWNC